MSEIKVTKSQKLAQIDNFIKFIKRVQSSKQAMKSICTYVHQHPSLYWLMEISTAQAYRDNTRQLAIDESSSDLEMASADMDNASIAANEPDYSLFVATSADDWEGDADADLLDEPSDILQRAKDVVQMLTND